MENMIGKYKVLREVGKGGMGIVYKGLDPTSKMPVAIKVLPQSMVDQSTVERFRREVRAMVKLDHPNIVKAYDFGMTKGQHYFTMEFVEGDNLKDIIKRKGPLSAGVCLHISRQVADVLRYTHTEAKLIHRDIKPANIIVMQDNQVKVMDFGLVQITDATRLTMDGSAVGTAEYMSPEQASGEQIDARSDIYSLGITMYEMLAGHPPFRGENSHAVLMSHKYDALPSLSDANAEVPPELEAIIEKTLVKDVSQRYQKADELLTEIKQLQQGNPAYQIEDVSGKVQEGISQVTEQFLTKDEIPKVLAVDKGKLKSIAVVCALCLVLGAGYFYRGKISNLFFSVGQLNPMIDSSEKMVKDAEYFLEILEEAEDNHTQGLMYEGEGKLDQAIKKFKKAIHLRPEHALYYKDLALAFEKKNQVNNAIGAWKNLLKYDNSYEFKKMAEQHINALMYP